MVKMMEGEETRGKRFGVLVCAEESEYMKEKHGGLFGVFVKFLSGEGENWSVFNVAKNEFPNDMELESYDGFVITGSCFDAHSNDVWIFNLLSLIKKLDSLKIRVLGICFGHQILCRSLGGKIGRAASGWDIGIRTVHIKPSSKKISSNFKIPSKLNVIKCHQDEVLELPAQVEVMAGSNKTSVEMFRYGDHMVGIQGHPEYTRDIVNHFIDRLLHHNIFTVKHANELRAQLMESCDPDREAWRKFCVNFLKGRL